QTGGINRMKKLSATILSFAMAAAMLTGCASNTESQANVQTAQTAVYAAAAAGQGANAAAGEAEAPKYVFLFIGDGMSYPQFQAASDYLGAIADTDEDGILDGNVPLSFMEFPVAGSAVTYDSTSFCPDSASTATSI